MALFLSRMTTKVSADRNFVDWKIPTGFLFYSNEFFIVEIFVNLLVRSFSLSFACLIPFYDLHLESISRESIRNSPSRDMPSRGHPSSPSLFAY